MKVADDPFVLVQQAAARFNPEPKLLDVPIPNFHAALRVFAIQGVTDHFSHERVGGVGNCRGRVQSAIGMSLRIPDPAACGPSLP